MRADRLLFAAPLLLTACIDMADQGSDQQAATDDMHGAPEKTDHMKDARPGGGGGSPLLSYGGGPVIHASKTMAIFWGSQWSDASFAGDKITGLDTFFGGWNGSQIAKASTEYSDGAGPVTA